MRSEMFRVLLDDVPEQLGCPLGFSRSKIVILEEIYPEVGVVAHVLELLRSDLGRVVGPLMEKRVVPVERAVDLATLEQLRIHLGADQRCCDVEDAPIRRERGGKIDRFLDLFSRLAREAKNEVASHEDALVAALGDDATRSLQIDVFLDDLALNFI